MGSASEIQRLKNKLQNVNNTIKLQDTKIGTLERNLACACLRARVGVAERRREKRAREGVEEEEESDPDIG